MDGVGYRVMGMKWGSKLNKELHGDCDAVDSGLYWTIKWAARRQVP
jgi:hypothetical protein